MKPEVLNAPLPHFQNMVFWHHQYDGSWIFERSLVDTWAIYTKTPATELWASKWIELKFSNINIEKSNTLQLGSRFYFDIRAGNLCMMPMALEVSAIEESKLIRLQYLDLSPAYGTQWIYFKPLSSNRTLVKHYTSFQGKNKMIDYLYPFYHNEALRRLHARALELSHVKH